MGSFALEATPSPPLPMASDFKDEDADDGDDDDASDDKVFLLFIHMFLINSMQSTIFVSH